MLQILHLERPNLQTATITVIGLRIQRVTWSHKGFRGKKVAKRFQRELLSASSGFAPQLRMLRKKLSLRFLTRNFDENL